jgi:phosphoadenosine phosphosulfate reductase
MTAVSAFKKPPPPRAPRVFDAAAAPADPALQGRLDELQRRYAGSTAQSLIEAAVVHEFKGQSCVVSSFGSESVVLLHLLSQVDPTVPILFLNTGKLFGETLRYRDRLQDRLGLTDIRSLRPHPADEARLDPDGVLWSKNPDACCNFRKTLPLQRAIGGFSAELTGRKRFQTKARAGIAPVELNGGRFVFNPLADWSLQDLADHILKHDLPRHPLVADGFLSIGCMPCTDRVKPGDDYRSGRWSGQDKEECGIHENLEGDGI